LCAALPAHAQALLEVAGAVPRPLALSRASLLDSEGLPSLRSLQDLRPGPRHVRWPTRIEVLLPPK